MKRMTFTLIFMLVIFTGCSNSPETDLSVQVPEKEEHHEHENPLFFKGILEKKQILFKSYQNSWTKNLTI